MVELGRMLEGLGPFFAVLFFALVIGAMIALFAISLPRLAHKG
jgi:hypothetical protein